MSVAEAPDKLGHNVNKGLEIALRLRFENGFRSYQSVKGTKISWNFILKLLYRCYDS